MGGKFHLKLNIDERPIANKYREGKMKRTLKRELNQYLKLLRGKRWKPVVVLRVIFTICCLRSVVFSCEVQILHCGAAVGEWVGWSCGMQCVRVSSSRGRKRGER